MRESGNFKNLTNLDARELNELGNVYVDYGMWDEALECYERSLSLRREAKDRPGEMVVLNNLGALYHRQALWDEALRCYRESREIAHKLEERESELATLVNVIFIHVTRSDVEGFLQLADEAEELAQEVEGWTPLSILYWLRGRQALTSSRDGEGMAYYAEALRLALKGGEATLQEMLAHVDKEVERLVARDSPGQALVLCDYLLVACEGIEGVRDHLVGKREELLSLPRLSGREGSEKEN
ncbi:MAG: tetratricopeptide repeat protein [Anaerolineae bacterium]